MERADLEQWKSREVARLLSLVEAERRYYQEIVATVPVGLALLASDLSFLSVNRTFREVVELPIGSLGRLRLDDIFPEESVASKVREVLATATSHQEILAEAVVRGERKPVRLAIQPFRGWGEDAAPEALLLVREADAVAQPEPAADTGDTARALAGELAQDLEVVLWERVAGKPAFTQVAGHPENVLGYTADQLLSEPNLFLQRVHPEDRKWLLTFYRSTAAGSSARSCEYRATRADDETVWLRDIVHASAEGEGEEQRITGITVDGTALKKLGDQHSQSERMAALTRLAGRISHDCNNLLMIMSGYGEQVLSSLPDDHAAREDVEEILTAAQRLAKVTSELLDFTRRPALSPKLLDLNSLIRGMEETVRHAAGDRVEVVLERGPALVRVTADPEALTNSLLRLIEYARDAMPGGGRITIRTANAEVPAGSPALSSALSPGTYATISVSDTGPTLTEEARQRLFEPFYTGPRAGPALPSVYSVVRDSGGDIAISSGASSGTTITIFLPRAAAAVVAPQEQAEDAGAVALAPALSRMETVLVVEDEAGIRALMRKILQKQGYNVLEAGHGEEALHLAVHRSAPIDLLLTDVVMPRMSGRELSERLKATRPEMKVLFVSGYTDEDLAQHGPLPAGAAFLQKPFSLAALLDKVRSLLNEVS